MSELIIQKSTLVEIGDAVRTMRETTDEIPVKNLASEILAIQSGVELNFEVVGGTSAPSDPVENLIWVNTDVDITSYIFSPVEPTEPAQGMLWIKTGSSSKVAFDALKKGGILIYPLTASQYVDGAWVSVTAKSYQGGEWAGWIVYLFDNGDQAEDITGGWTFVNGYSSGGCTGSVGETLTMNAIKPGSSTGNYYAGMQTNKTFPTNGASTLKIHFVSISASNGNSGNPAFFVTDYSGGNRDNFLASYTNLTETDYTLSVDISNLSSIRLFVGSHPWYSLSSKCTFEIDQFWFE